MRFLPLIVLLALTVEGKAQTDTVQELLPMCKQAFDEGKGIPLFSTGYCVGLVAGVSQVMTMNCELKRQGLDIKPWLTASLPPTNGAAAQAFINWANDNPQHWGANGTLGVMTALTETFPCQ